MPPRVSENQSTTQYSPGPLSEGVYFWRVVARDPQGFVTEGPTWVFSTGDDYLP